MMTSQVIVLICIATLSVHGHRHLDPDEMGALLPPPPMPPDDLPLPSWNFIESAQQLIIPCGPCWYIEGDYYLDCQEPPDIIDSIPDCTAVTVKARIHTM